MVQKLLTFVMICGALTTIAQDDKKNFDEAFQLMEIWLEAQKDYDNLPSITAAVIDHQKVLWSGAFDESNMESNQSAEVSTICSICSISKLFTSVAIMKLYDEGKLRLDDQVQDLLPCYTSKQQYPESGPVTVRSLLTHSSGLPKESAHPYWSGPDFPFPSSYAVKSGLEYQQTLYPASTYFQYSNLGMTLPGEIVAEGIRQILDKVEKTEEPDDSEEELDLTEYLGHFNSQPWWVERDVGSWNGKIVIIGLPTENPGESMTMNEHLEGDIFKRIRKDGEHGVELVFSRDENGKVYRMAMWDLCRSAAGTRSFVTGAHENVQIDHCL